MSLLTLSDVSRLADKCIQISEDVKDEKGYVSAKNLSKYFNAKIIFRPLLVEAMLAELNDSTVNANGSSHKNKWAVLLDSEPYPDLSELDIIKESQNSPLPNRLRFSVAHELAHTLAFRAKEFNVELTFLKNRKKNSKKEFVEEIERITDTISPLLLVPTSYLASVFTLDKQEAKLDDFLKIKREMSISYQVLVNRLKRLAHVSDIDLISRPSLRDVAVGVGVWSEQGSASIREWPLFVNFQRGIVPAFLYDLVKGKIRTFTKHIDSSEFILNGGSSISITTHVKAGTEINPASEDMKILVEVEPVQRRPGAEFLFLIKKVN